MLTSRKVFLLFAGMPPYIVSSTGVNRGSAVPGKLASDPNVLYSIIIVVAYGKGGARLSCTVPGATNEGILNLLHL